MKKMVVGVIALCLASAWACAGSCRFEKTTGMFAERQQPLLVLENDYVVVKIAPLSGGRVASLYYKKDKVELTARPMGLMADQLTRYDGDPNYWVNGSYAYEVVKESPEVVALRMSCRSDDWLGFEKTFTLRSDSSALLVNYAFSVGLERCASFRAGLKFSNSMGPAGERIVLYTPLTGGVERVEYNPEAPTPHQQFNYNLARGWRAVKGVRSGAGLAAAFEYPRTMCAYRWYGKDGQHTDEWFFRSFPVQEGGALRTEQLWMPFRGLETVSGVGESVVAGMVVTPSTSKNVGQPVAAKIQLYSARTAAYRIKTSCEKLPERITTHREERDMKVAADDAGETALTWTPQEPGTYAVHVEVYRGEEKVCDFEEPCLVGASKVAYMLPELEKRAGDPKELFGSGISEDDIPAFSLSDEIVQPHVEWAKPYARGSIKALFILDQQKGYEIIELSQRMSLDRVVPLALMKGRYMGPFYQTPADLPRRDLVRHLEKETFDVIVAAKNASLDGQALELLKRHVRNGTGLVWIGQPAPKELADVIPIAVAVKAQSVELGAWRVAATNHPVTRDLALSTLPPVPVPRLACQGEVLATATVNGEERPVVTVAEMPGGGRVVAILYKTTCYQFGMTELTGFLPDDMSLVTQPPYPYWEIQHALLVRAILWAAKKEPLLWPCVTSIDVTGAPGRRVAAKIDLSVNGFEGSVVKKGEVTIEMTLRDPYRRVMASETRPWNGAPVRIKTDAVLGAGTHTVELRVFLWDKVAGFAAVPFTVAAGSELKTVEIEDLDKHVLYEAGAELRCAIAAKNVVDGTVIRADLVDGVGRRLDRAERPAVEEKATVVSFWNRGALDGDGCVVVTLVKDGNVLDEQRRRVTLIPEGLSNRQWDDYEGVTWGNAPLRLGRLYGDALKRAGMTSCSFSGNWGLREPAKILRIGMKPSAIGMISFGLDGAGIQKAGRKYIETGDKSVLRRMPSFSDEKFVKQQFERGWDSVRRSMQAAPVCYSLIDELVFARDPVDLGFCPDSLQEFRSWLRARYKTLEALNKAWQQDYKSWESIVPPTMSEAAASGDYAPWVAFRTFCSVKLTDTMTTFTEEVYRIDPKARVGMSGTMEATAYSGLDWARLCRSLNCMLTYNGPSPMSGSSSYGGSMGELELLFRDLMKDPRILPYCTGYKLMGPQARGNIWRRMLETLYGVAAWRDHLLMNPDMTLSPQGVTAEEGTRFWREGLTKLLVNSERSPSRIALHFSMPSIIVNRLYTGDKNISDNRRICWLQALRDMGFPPRYLSYLDIEDGRLSRDKFDALVLPMSTALSDKEIAAIRKFVEAGGTLLADTLPGVTDEDGRFREEGGLNDVFGVTQPVTRTAPSGTLGALLPRAEARQLRLPPPEKDESLAAISGALRETVGIPQGTVGNIPVFVVNAFGQGKALLTNVDLSQYRRETGTGLRRYLTACARWAGAEQNIEVRDEKGEAAGIIRSVFRQGKNIYVGFAPEREQRVTLAFGKPYHVFNMRSGEYLGLRESVEVKLPADDGTLLSALPYRVTGLDIRGTDKAVDGGKDLELTLEIRADGSAGLHCVRVEVAGQDGKNMSHYAQNVLCPGGKGTVRIPFRYDVRGRIRVEARDVATGAKAAREFNVKAD